MRIRVLTIVLLGALWCGVAPSMAACTSSTNCDDGNLCTDDICDATLGCLHANNNLPCSDGNACTTGDACNGAVCVGGNTAAGCTACQAVADIPAAGGTFIGTTSGASTLTGSCGSSGSSPERVYRWTPTISGAAVIQTCGSGTLYDTVLYLRGSSCTGTEVACNDDTAGCSTGEPNDHHGSKITPIVTAGQTYYIVVDGYGGNAGTYSLTVVPPSVCGNGVREGTEQCDGADASQCATGQCTTSCTCVQPSSGLPDLTPAISDVSINWNATVATGDVAEGCAESTTANLLRFSTHAANAGTADFYLGDPMCPSPCTDYPLVVCGNPQFICSPAQGHNHAHYTNYAAYELLNGAGQTVVTGHKQGFCLLDSSCTAPASAKYTCSNQGITAGCSDTYGAGLGCQYIDITGVPAGNYTLRVTLDPFGKIAEVNEGNNVATTPLTIPTTTTTTLPSSCASPPVIPAQGGTFTGTTSGASALSGCVAATSSAPEAIFQWTPAVSGTATIQTCSTATTFDTVLYVQSGSCTGTQVACNDDTSGCATGDGCNTSDHHGSRVSFAVAAGTPYFIVVDGYGGSCGGSSGTFQLTVTAPAGTTSTTTATSSTTSSTTTTATTATTATTTTTTSSTTSTTATTATTTSSTTGPSTSTTTTTTTSSTTTTTIAANGTCGAPFQIPADGGLFPGKTGGVSQLSGSCNSTSLSPEVVYRWTPSRSGVADIQTCDRNTRYQTVLYVRRGSCAGTELVCSVTGCVDTQGSRVTPTVAAGETYYIVVDGNLGQSGRYKLKVTPP